MQLNKFKYYYPIQDYGQQVITESILNKCHSELLVMTVAEENIEFLRNMIDNFKDQF